MFSRLLAAFRLVETPAIHRNQGIAAQNQRIGPLGTNCQCLGFGQSQRDARRVPKSFRLSCRSSARFIVKVDDRRRRLLD